MTSIVDNYIQNIHQIAAEKIRKIAKLYYKLKKNKAMLLVHYHESKDQPLSPPFLPVPSSFPPEFPSPESPNPPFPPDPPSETADTREESKPNCPAPVLRAPQSLKTARWFELERHG